MQETQVWSLGQEDPLEKEMPTHSVFLPGKSHRQRSLAGYSPRGHKESNTTEQLTFDFHFICDGKGDPKSLEYLYIFPGFIYVLHGNKTGSRPLFSIKYFQLWKWLHLPWWFFFSFFKYFSFLLPHSGQWCIERLSKICKKLTFTCNFQSQWG